MQGKMTADIIETLGALDQAWQGLTARPAEDCLNGLGLFCSDFVGISGKTS